MKAWYKYIPSISIVGLILAILTILFARYQVHPYHQFQSLLALFCQELWLRLLVFLVFFIFCFSFLINIYENSTLVLCFKSKKDIFISRLKTLISSLLALNSLYFLICLIIAVFISKEGSLTHVNVVDPNGETVSYLLWNWLGLQFILNTILYFVQCVIALMIVDLTHNLNLGLGISVGVIYVLSKVNYFQTPFKVLMGDVRLIEFSSGSFILAIVFWIFVSCLVVGIHLQIFKHVKDFGMIKNWIES